MFNRWVSEQFTHGEAIATAEDQHLFRRMSERRDRGVNQRLVVAVLVVRAELQLAVQEKARRLA